MIQRLKANLQKLVSLIFFLVNTGCLTYTIATRFTDFLFAPRSEKIGLLAGSFIFAIFLSVFLYFVIFPSILRARQKKIFALAFVAAFISTVLIFLFAYSPPPFPERHTLSVTALGTKNPESHNSRVEIISVSTISYPSRDTRRIPKNQFSHDGIWRGVPGDEFAVFVEEGIAASFSLERFMQSGILIVFRTGPEAGKVSVIWDGVEQELDLYQPLESTFTLNLAPRLDWRSADRTRKILVWAAFLADFTAFFSVLTVIFIFLFQLIARQAKLDIRHGALLFASVLAILSALVTIQQVNVPVQFHNPQLEQGIRQTLNRLQGNIYRRQLHALVEIDLSGLGITTLHGLEELPNLITLDLQDNLITDISPLAGLEKLESLNLRGNSVADISPLSRLTRLEYLNLSGNTSITSISSISDLGNLRKLILRGVDVSSEEHLLSGLVNLEYLNLRNSSVSELAFLSSLEDLHYLNLHSNPTIRSIEPIADLTDLETLILVDIPLSGQEDFLSELNDLRYLNLRNTDISEVGFLSKMRGLEYLNLHSNALISDISPIAHLTNLEHLILRDVPVGGMTEILSDLTHLQTLNVRNTGIRDLTFLSNLLANGVLQDDERLDTIASLDIRDNPISSKDSDAYADIRPYWTNITFREPLRLPFFAVLDSPLFSHESGFYEKEFLLSISSGNDADIFYTLDGSEPTSRSSIYTAPIQVNTNTFPLRTISNNESIAVGWKAPKSEIQKAVIIRAKAINTSNGEESQTISHIYFLGPEMKEKYSLPIVSIAMNYADLYHPVKGIYTLGENYAAVADQDMTEDEKQVFANFDQHGEEWERVASFEIIDLAGNPVFSQNIGVRIHGAGSRRSAQKSLRVYADCAYDINCVFTYPLFSPSPLDDGMDFQPAYESFLLRNNGQDWMIGMMRDALASDVLLNTGLDIQQQQPVIVFLNGEYWGIYQFQERLDQYYLANKYGLGLDETTILRQNGGLFRGSAQDVERYAEFTAFIRQNSLSDPKNFEYVRSQVEIESYTDYLIANIFLANTDWPENNIYLWRRSLENNDPDAEGGYDGRWRWMIFDMDFSFGLQGYGTGYEHNTLQLAQMEGWSGELFRSLLENQEYHTYFINRFAYHLNTTFSTSRLLQMIENRQQILEPEMEEFFARWGSNNEGLMEKWLAEIGDIRIFAEKRKEYVSRHIIDQFSLSGTSTLHISHDPTQGSVFVNGLLQTADGGVYFNDTPITITVLANDGYTFSHWEETASVNPELVLRLNADLDLTPVFQPVQSAEPAS